jgi:2'-5' RNA ligase
VKKRLFIAIDIPDNVRQLAVNHINRLRESFPEARLSWTRPGNLHLTLKFLGDVDDSSIDRLCHELKNLAAERATFYLAVRGTGTFPSVRRAKVLWLGINDIDGALVPLASAIEQRLSQMGFATDDRKFSPHLTIGRVRQRDDVASQLAEKHAGSVFASPRFTISEIALYSSTLSSGGSIYQSVCTAPLRPLTD